MRNKTELDASIHAIKQMYGYYPNQLHQLLGRDLQWAFQAGAEWQRTQAQPADAYRMARALSDRYADQCGVDRDDNWKIYGQDFIEDVRAMLAAAPQPVAQQKVVMPKYQDAEDLLHPLMKDRAIGWNACLDEFERLNGSKTNEQ